MQTKYGRDIYICIKSEVLRSTNKIILGNGSLSGKNSSYAGMVKVYSDTTAATLKSNAILAYPVHGVLMNFSKEVHKYLIDHGYRLAGLLPVSTSGICTEEEEINKRGGIDLPPVLDVVPLYNYLPAGTNNYGRKLKLPKSPT